MPHKDPDARREYERAYYRAKGEKRLARQRAEYAAKREERCTKRRAEYARSHERRRAYARDYAEKNPDKIRAWAVAGNRTYRAAHPEKVKERERKWRTKNAERVREISRRRRARRFSAGSGLPRGFAAALLAAGCLCSYCLKAQATTLDHVVPLTRGGLDEPDNIVAACVSCNASKGTRTLLELLMSPHLKVTQRMVAP